MEILLVEDSPGDVDLLKYLLWDVPNMTYHVTRLERLAQLGGTVRSRRFDVLLLDLSLPDSCGLETISRAAAAAPDIPIVVLTGMDDEELGVQALNRGAQDYIVKGEYDGWHLWRAIRYAIERKKNRLELRKAGEETEQWILQNLGVLAAVRWLGKSMKEACGLVMQVASDTAGSSIVADEHGTCAAILDVVRELLSALAKRAHAVSACLELTRPDPSQVRVTSSEFGAGIDPGVVATSSDESTDLPAILRRVEALGGQIDIANEPSRGCQITLTVPLPASLK
ncbi:MAG: response regulator [Planctomycetota bacterium]|nr:response regulator [Planctomycetota bacterium]